MVDRIEGIYFKDEDEMNGEEKFIRNVIHLQNVGGGEFVALFEGEKTLTLLVDRIEGIYGRDRNGSGENE